MEYMLKVHKRKEVSGTMIKANIVAEDENGVGRATGYVEIPIVIEAEKVPDREYCLRRKAKIDSKLTSNNKHNIVEDKIYGLKENLNTNANEEETGTTAKVSGADLVNPQDNEKIEDYLNFSDYSIRKHPVYTGLSNDSDVKISIPIKIERNSTVEIFTKIFTLARYTKEDVFTALVAAFSNANKARGEELLWKLIRGERNARLGGGNILAFDITDSIIKDKNKVFRSEIIGSGATAINNATINEIVKKYTNESDEALPDFRLKWTWSSGTVPGFEQYGDEWRFNRPAANEIDGQDTKYEVTSQDDTCAGFVVGYNITNTKSYFSAVIDYGEGLTLEFKTGEIKVRTKNITLQQVKDNVQAGIKAFWYGLNSSLDDSVATSGNHKVELDFGSNRFVALKIPLTVEGISQNPSDNGNGVIIPDVSSIGYHFQWRNGEQEVVGFHTNKAKRNIFSSKLTYTVNHSHPEDVPIGYIIKPLDAEHLGYEFTDANMPTVINANNTITNNAVEFASLVNKVSNSGWDYFYLVFDKDLFDSANITSIEFSNAFCIKAYNTHILEDEVNNNYLDTTEEGTGEIDFTTNFKVSV